MNNLSRVTVILASLASLVAIVWMLTQGVTPPPPPPAKPEPDITETKRDVIEVAADTARYPAVNEPDKILNVRRPGHVYETEVIGQLSGEGSSKDWGMKGDVKFRMTYSLKSIGEVESNDGRTIVELRRFKYSEALTLDPVRAGLDLSEGQAWMISAVVGGLGEFLTSGTTGGTQVLAVRTAIDTVNGRMFEIPPEGLKAMATVAKWTGLSSMDLEKGLKVVLPRPEFGILDGKTVRLTFEDGKGITRIEPVGCSISPQEELNITRANNLSDHYIFPDRTRAVGQAWEVPADNLGSLVDPRLRGTIVSRPIRLKRTDDTTDDKGGRVLNVSIDGEQKITMSKTGEGREVTGEMNVTEARFELQDSAGVVTSASASGTVEYRERTTDHLLFGAEIRGRPSFEVFVRTTVSKKP
jgi:hypothetical protein